MRVRAAMLAGMWCLATAATVGDPVVQKSAAALEQYRSGEYAAALNLYRDALVDRPEAPELHFYVGDALFKNGDYEKALQEFAQVLKAPGEKIRAQAHYNMGNSYFQQQAFEQAVESYKQSLQLDPADEDAKVNLELALEQLQQQDQDQQDQQDQQQSEAGEDEPISPREAEQLLDALEDREQEAQKRRFRAVGRAQDKDW